MSAIAVTGCDDGDETDTSGTPGGASADLSSVEGYAQAWAKTFCERLFSCCTPSDLEVFDDPMLKDQASCEQKYVETILDDDEFLTGPRRGATYNPSGAAACIAELAAAACDEFYQDLRAPCAETYQGTVELGGSCNRSEECAGEDTYCRTVSFDMTCQRLAGEGEPCNDYQCAKGLRCDDTADACVRAGEVGKPCSENLECWSDSCDGSACAEGRSERICNGR